MDEKKLRILLKNLQNNKITVNEVIESIKDLPFKDMGFAKIDSHRELRKGFPEVIFGIGKTEEQINKIIENMIDTTDSIMVTKIKKSTAKYLLEKWNNSKHYESSKILLIGKKKQIKNKKIISVLSGGTADIPFAEEAAVTAEIMGNNVQRIYDVGVAGLHRLLGSYDKIKKSNVIIVIAGMDGALASVVAGLFPKPVIAVPTSIGYGANLDGLSTLLSMLNSCAAGVMTVNINNGFGAGYAASLINQLK